MNNPPETAPERTRRRRRRPYHPLDGTPDTQATPSEPPPDPPLAAPDTVLLIARQQRARSLVRRYAALSGGAAAIPLPLVDAFTVGGLQIQLIRTLAKLYEIPFDRERSRAALLGLLVGAEVGVFSMSLARIIPGLGYLAVAGPGAVLFSGLSYALGRVFIQHFEAGGTLLDFDPAVMRAHFQRELALRKRQKNTPRD